MLSRISCHSFVVLTTGDTEERNYFHLETFIMKIFHCKHKIFSNNFKGIKPIINLLNECNKRNFKVIIITARDSIYIEDTVQDLLNIGIYPNQDNLYNSNYYDYIYLRHSPKDNHNLFKSDIKKKLYDNGIQTIMSIGDNDVDINGNYSGYAIKLPNTKAPMLFHKNNL